MGRWDYLVGAGFFFGVLGAALVTALLLARRRLPGHTGSARAAAVATLALAALVAAHLLPAVMTVLSRGTVLATAVVLCVAAWFVPPREKAPTPPPAEPEEDDGMWSWAMAIAAAGLVAAYGLAFLADYADHEVRHFDTLTFHLPNIIDWIQSGTVWRVDQYVPDANYGNYPQNGDVWLMAWVLPWSNDAFVRFADAPLLAVAGLTVFALCREVRASRPTALMLAALFLSVPVVWRTGLDYAMADPFLYATFPAGLLFLLRHRRSGDPADLALAGAGLGLALGAKWYGVSAFAVVLVVWAGASLLARERVRAVLLRAASIVAVALAAGGVWLLRNVTESGNPLMPLKVEVLGVTVFDAPPDLERERYGYSISEFFDDLDAVRHEIVPRIDAVLEPAGWVLLAGIAAFLLVALVTLVRRDARAALDGRLVALAVAGALLVVAYLFTPNSALGVEGRPVAVEAAVRYLAPALIVGAALCAAALRLVGWLRLPAQFAALALVAVALNSQDAVPRGDVVKAAVVLGVIAAVVLALLRLAPGRTAGLGLAVGAAAAVVGLGAAGYSHQRSFNDGRYLGVEPALNFLAGRDEGEERIGIVGRFSFDGVSPILPVFGRGLDNEVVYLGHFVDGTLRDYRDPGSFAAAVERARVDWVLVGRGYIETRPRVKQEEWLRRQGYTRALETRRMAVYGRRALTRY